MKGCVFCEKFNGLNEEVRYLDFEPLHPVAEGHRLVVPREHVADFAEDPEIAVETMAYAARVAKRYPSFNIITSKGAEATQSVFHFHVHVIPRKEGDNLALPWTGRKH